MNAPVILSVPSVSSVANSSVANPSAALFTPLRLCVSSILPAAKGKTLAIMPALLFANAGLSSPAEHAPVQNKTILRWSRRCFPLTAKFATAQPEASPQLTTAHQTEPPKVQMQNAMNPEKQNLLPHHARNVTRNTPVLNAPRQIPMFVGPTAADSELPVTVTLPHSGFGSWKAPIWFPTRPMRS